MSDNKKLMFKVARTIIKAGRMPVPVSDTFINILKILLTEEQSLFIVKAFKKPSLTFDQIKERVKEEYDEEMIKKILNDLLSGGILSSAMSQSAGVRVYRLMQPMPGLMEYSLLHGRKTDREKKLAILWHKLYEELSESTQRNYDSMVKQMKQMEPIDRVVPVEVEVDFDEIGEEIISPYEEVSKYIDEFEDIAVAHCYCRHEKDLIDDPCKLNAPKKNCFFFDKSAKHVVDQGFGKTISKEEAKHIFKEAEEYGLVHKVFHVHANPKGKIEAICNCCKCCCGPFQMYHTGAMPIMSLSSYLAVIDEDECIGCEICVERCPINAIEITDENKALVIENKCIGCGVCAHFCPQDPKAITLNRTGLRKIFIPPPRIR